MVVFDSFELHHFLQRHNEAADALARLGSSYELPPPGVFIRDFFKPSIQLEEVVSAPTPRMPLGKDRPMPAPRTPPSKYGTTLISEADTGTSVGANFIVLGARGRNSGHCGVAQPQCKLAKTNL
jgi:hypothetical protein